MHIQYYLRRNEICRNKYKSLDMSKVYYKLEYEFYHRTNAVQTYTALKFNQNACEKYTCFGRLGWLSVINLVFLRTQKNSIGKLFMGTYSSYTLDFSFQSSLKQKFRTKQ